ncbi:hypothetical protein TcYC6_0003730 [Trypanosoma cruzi]|nr:hypothetical protein TcYC6_0003730 [Trypanosoma cruzi]
MAMMTCRVPLVCALCGSDWFVSRRRHLSASRRRMAVGDATFSLGVAHTEHWRRSCEWRSVAAGGRPDVLPG